jgi:hypothetical protein
MRVDARDRMPAMAGRIGKESQYVLLGVGGLGHDEQCRKSRGNVEAYQRGWSLSVSS